MEYVDNDVYKYRVSLDINYPEIVVYTKPLEPCRNVENIFRDDYEKMKENLERKVKEKYFTEKRLHQIKKDICDKIMGGEYPLNIYLDDTDGGYNVTEDMLFDVE